MLIDCPPSLGLLTINALTTANEIFIPIQAEFFALEGLTKLIQTIDVVKSRLNSKIDVTWIIVTMFDGRKNICKDVSEKVYSHFKKKVFKLNQENVRLAERRVRKKYRILASSHGWQDYKNLQQKY